MRSYRRECRGRRFWIEFENVDPYGREFTIEGGKGSRRNLVGMCRWTCLTCCEVLEGIEPSDAELSTELLRELNLDES